LPTESLGREQPPSFNSGRQLKEAHRGMKSRLRVQVVP
jgi:hypothetical protein